MHKTILSLLLMVLLVQGFTAAPALAQQVQTDAQAVEKIRLKVAKLGVGEKARVTVWTKDGTKRKGFISQAGAEDFTVRDRKTGDPTTIRYSDVTKLDNNRGHSSLRNILIGVGIGAGVVITVLAILVSQEFD